MKRSSEKKTVKAKKTSGEVQSGSPRTMISRNLLQSTLVHVLIIIVLGLIVYSNSFHAPFQWDDRHFIIGNPIIKDFSYFLDIDKASGLGMLFEHFENRYIGYLTFALNYSINGLDVTGYHVINFMVHLLNALLVYALVVLTFKTPVLRSSALSPRSGRIALVAALLFVAHPVNTEAVTYIYQRLASLAALFYLLSVTSYAASRITDRRKMRYGFLALALVSTVLGMKTKENTFTIPVTIILYEFFFFHDAVKPRIARLTPFVLTLFIIPYTMFGFDRPSGNIMETIGSATVNAVGIDRWDYFFTQMRVIMTYIRLLFIPVDQTVAYDYPLYSSFLEPPVLVSSLFLITLFCSAIYLYRKSGKGDPGLRVISFGILWFFVTLSVESSIIPIQMIIDEYRVYLPSVGLIMAVVTGGSIFAVKTAKPGARVAAVVVTITVLTVFSAAAIRRNAVWGSEISLWEDVIRKAPQNERGHTNLGNAYLSTGSTDDAIEHFLTVERLDPENAGNHVNLGNAYLSKGMREKAMEHYRASLHLSPDNAEVHNNLANLYMMKGMQESAIDHYSKALALEPGYAEAHNNLGNAYASKGRLDDALDQYNAAIGVQPDYVQAHFNSGLVYLKKGQKARAIDRFRTALRLDPSHAKARRYIDELTK